MLLIEYLISLIKNADSDTQEQYKGVLCDEEGGFPSEIFDLIVEDLKDRPSEKHLPNELLDVKWKLVNFSSSDQKSLNFLLVHLTLVYNDHTGRRTQRTLVQSLEEFAVFNRKFNDLSENF